MQAGKDTEDIYRIKMGMQSHNADPACLYSLRKDHKKGTPSIGNEGSTVDEGPPVRPVCDVTDGISHRLSYLLSNLLKEVCYGETVCNSTGQMLAAIKKTNDRGIGDDYVVGSMDVIALYPSIDIEHAVEVVAEEFDKMKITVDGIDFEELGLYIALCCEAEEIANVGLVEVCPTRNRNGRKPEITGSGVKVQKHERFEPWDRARRVPTDEAKSKMFKTALKVALKVVLKNHTYEFNQEIRRQTEGGPIGMDLTGTVAKIYMKWWDGELIRRMRLVGIEPKILYERYVDDINQCVKATEVGARYINGRLVVTEDTIKEDEMLEADLRTFRLIKQIGDSIHPSIQLEIDVPSNYPDNKVPNLDLKVWIEVVDTGDKEERKILHQHYVKPMANKYVILMDAAMATRSKRTILTQMCLRVLLNNSVYLKEEDRRETVEMLMKRMQATGYSEMFRYQVLKSAIMAYEKIKGDPLRPMYRSKESDTPRERAKRNKQRREWFRKGGYESVMFVPATPHSMLRKMVEEEVASSTLKIKVVERTGVKVKNLLQRNNPYKKKTCDDNGCFVCSTTRNGSCRKSGITYKISCKGDCDGDCYHGETHANGYTRGSQHVSDYEHKREGSVMWKHCVKRHGGEEQVFDMEVVDYVREDPTMRQILEAIRISEVEEEHRINDREEWIVGRIPSVTVSEL